MKTMGLDTKSKQGQALIIVALAIVALAAAVGLAIDGGRLYELRRQVQNGADAAAMAGTREIAVMVSECSVPDNADALVWAKVLEFAALNGVVVDPETGVGPDGDREVKAWYVGGGYIDREHNPLEGTPRVGVGAGCPEGMTCLGHIPVGATGVAVTLVATDTTTFMRVVGQSHIVASGEATAMAGPVTAVGGGILPIAVPKPVVDALDDEGGSFLIMGNGDFCDITGCDPETDNPPQAQAGWLQLGHVFNKAYSDPDGPPFRTFIYSMAASGCHTPPIDNMDKIGVVGWAELGCDYPYLLYAGDEGDLGGDFVAGKTGAVATGIHEVQDRIDQGETTAVVPMFDYIYVGECQEDETCMESMFAGQEPPGGWMTGASKYYYHLVGFVTVELLGTSNSDKSIQAEFVSQSVGKGVISPSSGLGSGSCQPSELIGVAMWE